MGPPNRSKSLQNHVAFQHASGNVFQAIFGFNMGLTWCQNRLQDALPSALGADFALKADVQAFVDHFSKRRNLENVILVEAKL